MRSALPVTPPDAEPTEADLAPWIHLEPDRTERATRRLTRRVWRHWFRLSVHGSEHVPTTGGVVLAPNHSSYIDPFVQAWGQPRLVRFMAKASIFELPLVGHVVRSGGSFPVRRGASDRFAMELARRLLRDGQVVMVYPEGTRYRTSLELGPPRSGAARLALDAEVPVVPVATWGVKEAHLYGRRRWQRPRAVTVFGEAIATDAYPRTRAGVEQLRDDVWAAVAALYDQARRIAQERAQSPDGDACRIP